MSRGTYDGTLLGKHLGSAWGPEDPSNNPRGPQGTPDTPKNSWEITRNPRDSHRILLNPTYLKNPWRSVDIWGSKEISRTLDKGSGIVGKPRKFQQIRGNPKASQEHSGNHRESWEILGTPKESQGIAILGRHLHHEQLPPP